MLTSCILPCIGMGENITIYSRQKLCGVSHFGTIDILVGPKAGWWDGAWTTRWATTEDTDTYITLIIVPCASRVQEKVVDSPPSWIPQNELGKICSSKLSNFYTHDYNTITGLVLHYKWTSCNDHYTFGRQERYWLQSSSHLLDTAAMRTLSTLLNQSHCHCPGNNNIVRIHRR